MPLGKKENERSKNDAVCTPPSVFEPVLEALGISAFDLDPCSHPRAIIPVHTCVLLPKYSYDNPIRVQVDGQKQDFYFGDGLAYDWSDEDTWLNPPYSQLQYYERYQWLRKLAYEARRGVAFLPSRTSSKWWHEGVLNNPKADILVQLKGRVHHHGEKWGSPFHQVLVAYNVIGHQGLIHKLTLERWRAAFDHPHKAFVSSLRSMRNE